MDNLLEIKKISKVYKDDKKKIEALKKISLDIKKAEIITLLGVNGAGKTTLSSIIATLLKPSDGDIFYKGRSIYSNVADFRNQLGFCPQFQNLDMELNVRENLIFAGRYYRLSSKEIKKRIEELLQQFDLKKYEDFNLKSLSGGYRQRFMIARTLVHSPKIIIMDEPTVGLDPKHRRLLWKNIMDLKDEGRTIILTTHYLDEADILSDRVCVIDEGQIKTIDTPKRLKEIWKSKNLEDIFLELIKERDVKDD